MEMLKYGIICDSDPEAVAFAEKLNPLLEGMDVQVTNEPKQNGKTQLSGLFDFSVTAEENKLILQAKNALSYRFLGEYLKREVLPKIRDGQRPEDFVYSQSALKDKSFVRYWLEGNTEFPYGEHFAYETHQNRNITLPYRIYVPFHYDPRKRYPLLLNLHGAGNRGSDNKRHLLFINRILSDPELEIDQAIILYPHCSLENKWVHTDWTAGSYDLTKMPESEELKAVLELVELVKKQYSIDESRMYLMGYSMGGYGTWNILMNHPDLFTAAVPMCGAGDPNQAERIKNIPIWAVHGAKDPIVPVSGSRDMAAALEKAGARDFHYTELPEVQHDAWNYTFSCPEIFKWLFGQRKP